MTASIPSDRNPAGSEDVAEQFRELSCNELITGAVAFFENLGIAARLESRAVEPQRKVELGLGAAIGFVSDSVRGTLTLAPDQELLVRSHPLSEGSGQVTFEQQVDWLGEMANQILGRCKNRMVAHGINLMCDTPLSVSGVVRVGALRRPAMVLVMDCGSDRLRLWWDVQVDPDLQLTRSETAQQEGDLRLF